jgi:hypothetical protein
MRGGREGGGVTLRFFYLVMPAKAGISIGSAQTPEMPAFAGMTEKRHA